MSKVKFGLRGWLRAVALVLIAGVALASTPDALAAKVHLKDGKVLEGTVKSEATGFIVFIVKVGSVQQTRVIDRNDIVKLEKDDAVTDPAAATPAAPGNVVLPATRPEDVKIPDGATKVAFVTLGDGHNEMVGPYMNRDALMKSVEILDELPKEQRPDILVLQINSGGGALSEMLKLTETIHKEIKPKYRTACWIQAAISAAAMTAFASEEIYMMKQGNIGACTGFSMSGGKATAMDGEGLERVLEYMEKVSKWGKRDPLIMRAMQIAGARRGNQPLTCDIDADGIVTWYDGPKGKFLVCPGDEILTLNAPDAVKYGVAIAVADTKVELGKAMGLTEWVEVGPEADAYQEEFRTAVRTGETRLSEFMSKYNTALGYAGSAPTREELERQVGIARNHLRKMKSLIDNAPSLKIYNEYGIDDDWFRSEDERLRKALAKS